MFARVASLARVCYTHFFESDMDKFEQLKNVVVTDCDVDWVDEHRLNCNNVVLLEWVTQYFGYRFVPYMI